MTAITLLGTTLGLGFTAGLNLYATILATGIAMRLGWLALPAPFEGLRVLSDPVVLVVAGVLYVVEFIADKVPLVEHAWDAVHTVVRPIGGVWIAWAALSGTHLSEPVQLATLLLVGGITAGTHLGKAGSRVVATASGGHLFGLNMALSVLEDAVTFVVAPLAIAHPLAALIAVAVVGFGLFAVATKGYRYLRGTRRQARAY